MPLTLGHARQTIPRRSSVPLAEHAILAALHGGTLIWCDLVGQAMRMRPYLTAADLNAARNALIAAQRLGCQARVKKGVTTGFYHLPGDRPT